MAKSTVSKSVVEGLRAERTRLLSAKAEIDSLLNHIDSLLSFYGDTFPLPTREIQPKKRRGRPPKGSERRPDGGYSAPLEEKQTRPTYDEAFRMKVVKAINGGMPYGTAAKKFGVTWFTVREWHNKYGNGTKPPKGTKTRKLSARSKRQLKQAVKHREKFEARTKQPVYSDDFKRTVVEDITTNNLDYKTAAEKHGTTIFSARAWYLDGRWAPQQAAS